MSHFVTLVIGENIDEQMEPYAEQEVDPKYLEFEDIEDESMNEYLNKDIELIMLTDGSFHRSHDDCFVSGHDGDHRQTYAYPEDSVQVTGKYTQLYSTFEEFMSEYHGNDERDPDKNRYGYWNNPNAKWDWYVIGGRWTGYFKPMDGAEGFLGRSGVGDNVPTEGWVDSLLVKNIDIAGMKAESAKEANDTYDILDKILNGRELPSWNKIRDAHGEDTDAAREEYNNHPVLRDLREAKFYCWDDLVETYGPNREAYVERRMNSTMVPFSFVMDGKWYQRGEMGWFGASTDEMSLDEWCTKFWELINSLPPDTQITAVDCHI